MVARKASRNIAVLINTDEPVFVKLMQESYVDIFHEYSPDAKVVFFDPVTKHEYPDVTEFDLIVVGGGTYIPDENSVWIKSLTKFIEDTTRDYPAKKMVGICLGHQIGGEIFGARLEYIPKAELGVHRLQLTEEGREFFSSVTEDGTVALHELHRRALDRVPDGFIALATERQILLSKSNSVLFFQGHPELTEEFAVTILSGSNDYVRSLSDSQRKAIIAAGRQPHDGRKIWRRIMQWVDSP